MPRALSTISIINYSVSKSPKRKKIDSHTLVVSQKKNRVFLFSLIICIVLTGVFFFNLFLNVKLVESNLKLKEVEYKLGKIETETQNLESQIIQSFSIDKTRGVAKKLNLVEAENIKFVKIPKFGNLSLER